MWSGKIRLTNRTQLRNTSARLVAMIFVISGVTILAFLNHLCSLAR